jgi:LAO/AO transport system kinase
VPSLLDSLRAREPRALARAISLSENDPIGAAELFGQLEAVPPRFKIGFTGPPGSGKSTLIHDLLEKAVSDGLRVGVIAVDPSSPFSGGALLGDRLRMQLPNFDPKQVFIRSLSSRGHLGGLSPGILSSLGLLEYYGFNLILLETVGVGQAEVEVMYLADLVAVVLVPGMGDEIQAMKSGLMEIADLYVINKCHHPGVEALTGDLLNLLSAAPRFKEENAWVPELLRTEAIQGEGIEPLYRKLLAYLSDERFQVHLQRKRRRQLYYQVYQSVVNHFRVRVTDAMKLISMDPLTRPSVHDLTRQIIEEICRSEQRSE